MGKKGSRVIGIIMLAAAIVFVVYALGHPEASWPWSNTTTYTLYILYLLVMVVLMIAPFGKKKNN